MCRYGMRCYKGHLACFACRKMFRGADPRRPAPHDQRARLCPDCRRPLVQMGLDFAPPKRTDTRGWRAAELLFAAAISFASCGCSGPGYRPRSPNRVPAFVQEQRDARRSHGERLLQRFAERR